MKSLLVLLIGVLVFAVNSHSQDTTSAPVNWVRYKTSDSDLSIMFPKMPMRENQEDVCREFKSSVYFSYADGIVYEFGVYTKSPRRDRFNYCYGGGTKFEQTIRERVAKLREEKDPPAESIVDIEGRSAVAFTNDVSTRWMIAYPDRWIELAVHHYANEKPDIDRFFKSLEWSAKSGTEIGAGSGVILGDPEPETKSAVSPAKGQIAPGMAHAGSGQGDGTGASPAAALNSEALRVISQPKARYTDKARKENVKGSVLLKITLRASGRVGAVTPVTTLPHGITEEAIAAARRTVFLPKRVNKIPVSVIVSREYTFVIY